MIYQAGNTIAGLGIAFALLGIFVMGNRITRMFERVMMQRVT